MAWSSSCRASVELAGVPERAVLVLEQHQLVAVHTRRAAGVVGEHQGEQAADLALVGHQGEQDPAQPDRLRREVDATPVALVEDQVDHGQHHREAVGQQVVRRDPERDRGPGDLLLGPGEPALHRLRRDQEGRRDLVGRQPAHGAQRQRDLCVLGERRMTAREEQLEPLVGDGVAAQLSFQLVVHGRHLIWSVEQRELRLEPSAGGAAGRPPRCAPYGPASPPGCPARRREASAPPHGRTPPGRRPRPGRSRGGGRPARRGPGPTPRRKTRARAGSGSRSMAGSGQCGGKTSGRTSTAPPIRAAGTRPAISSAASRSSASSR